MIMTASKNCLLPFRSFLFMLFLFCCYIHYSQHSANIKQYEKREKKIKKKKIHAQVINWKGKKGSMYKFHPNHTLVSSGCYLYRRGKHRNLWLNNWEIFFLSLSLKFNNRSVIAEGKARLYWHKHSQMYRKGRARNESSGFRLFWLCLYVKFMRYKSEEILPMNVRGKKPHFCRKSF